MNQALLLNVGIILAVIVCMIALQNPLALFGLLLIKEMPYGLMLTSPAGEEEEASGNPIGFVQ